MKYVLAAVALALAYGLWWVAPGVLRTVGLGWTEDFGQLCFVILVLSVLGKIGERYLPT